MGILKGERFGNISDRILGVGAHFDTVKTTAGKYIYNNVVNLVNAALCYLSTPNKHRILILSEYDRV